MKKLVLLPAFCLALSALFYMSCQKETMLPAKNAAGSTVTERGLPTVDPCARRTVALENLAAKTPIYPGPPFGSKWKWGELDRIANDCVLDGTIPSSECAYGGTASFYGNPDFAVSNFMDANGNITPAEQDHIIALAFAYAYAHISCGEGSSPKIYAIDFTIFPTGLETEVQFAVKYSCCPTSDH